MAGGNHIMDKQAELIKQLQQLNILFAAGIITFFILFIILLIILMKKFFNHNIKCQNCNEGELFIVRSEKEEEHLTYKCNNPDCPTNHQYQ